MLKVPKNIMIAYLFAIAFVQIAKGAPSTDDPEEEVLSACQLPKDVGDCDKNLTQYFFNSDSEECEEFTFGGCNGNENKFDSIAECNEACKQENEDKSNAYRMGFDQGEVSIKKLFIKNNPNARFGLGFYGYPNQKPYGPIGHPQYRNNWYEFEPENKWGPINYYPGYPYGGNNNILGVNKHRLAALGYNRGREGYYGNTDDKKTGYGYYGNTDSGHFSGYPNPLSYRTHKKSAEVDDSESDASW
uniref:Kunitz/BPTI-like toxin n=1 Tax=Lepeophtheirus salmonis TaxID=72036 RepID=D3PFM6_LEPSM|nr:Kunitz/BPTI-like toxin [Lepeophtheirus salmonis]